MGLGAQWKLVFLGRAVILLESVEASFEQSVELNYSSAGGITYSLIITVVEANREITWHQGGTSEKYKNCGGKVTILLFQLQANKFSSMNLTGL